MSRNRRGSDSISNVDDEDKVSMNRKDEENPHFQRTKFSIFSLPGMGIICALLSAFFFALNALFAKLIHLDGIQITMCRLYVQFLILLPIVFYKRNEVDVLGPVGLRRFLWIRGCTGSIATVFMYLTISNLSVGNAITMTYMSIMLVPFIARIFLRESLTILDIIFAVVSLIGVILIARPAFLFPNVENEENENKAIGVTLGILTALFQATTMVILRKLGKVYTSLNVLYPSIIGSGATTILLTALGKFEFPCLHEIPFILGVGVTGLVGQYLIVISLGLERAGTVSILRSVQIIMVYILQITVLENMPSTLSLIGASLVLSGSIGIGVRKIVNERRQRRLSTIEKAEKQNSTK